MFEPLPARFDFPAAEKRILAFWDEHDIFGQSLKLREGAERFVFYEGPPTANGLPHPGHCLTRVMKDIFPRYKTMRGFLVERKGGWDTHGLPVEREVCKELEIRTKQEIEAYGVEKFNLKCIQSVFRYTREWEDMTRRLAYWIDLPNAYVTYHQSYVESVWWSLKTLFDRGVLYQGHKVVWWWAQGGTALSSGEVGEGYRTVDDPSVFVKFPLVEAVEPGVLKAKDDPELAEQLAGLMAELRSGVASNVTIDFTNTKFVTSASLGRLLDFKKVVTASGLRLRLRGMNDTLRKFFAAVALDNVFEIEPAGGAETGGAGIPKKTSLLVWTTTPWTLISNHFAALHPDLEYALVHDPVDDEHLYVAAKLVETIAKKVKRELREVSTCKGTELIGRHYMPPFQEPYYAKLGSRVAKMKGGGEASIGWRVTAADFVTIDSGSGIVHEAPAFGEVDFDLLQEERKQFDGFDAVPLLCAVAPDGSFNEEAPERYRRRWVKECDREITRELRDERKTPWGTPLLYHQEQYRHDYPFCPQAPDDPLIQYARKSWFVRTSQFKDEFLKNNAAINWLPEHIKEGRFGDFLRNNVDWALSRERYWGTPLPIWRCESCGKMEAIGSFAELQSKPGATDGGYWERKVDEHKGEEFPAHLRVHKPYIDEWRYECPECSIGTAGKSHGEVDRRQDGGAGILPAGGQNARPTHSRLAMRRVPEVIDCWWDAGSMPFAQWGFPHADGSVQTFAQRFPADFISEAIDQTRGWFYGMLAISTLLFGPEGAVRQSYKEFQADMSAWAEKVKQGRAALPERDTFHLQPLFEKWRGTGLAQAGGFFNLDPSLMMLESIERDLCAMLDEDPTRYHLNRNSNITGKFPVPFRTCIVLGHIAGEDGNKMSKKLRNYKEPSYIFDTLGADAMRWYFLSAQAPWTSTRFAEAAIRDSQREFLVKLYNVLSFFTIYASIDGFDPSKVGDIHFAAGDDPRAPAKHANPMNWRPTGQRTELDRWIVTELRNTVTFVRESMDRFENYPAAQKLNDFVDALSNWYVRRSRDRFWRHKTPGDQEKWDAYHTLYGCLRVLSHLTAPFTPFFAENMHQILRMPDDPISIHLCDYPTPEDIRFHDDALAATMDTVRDLVALGRSARTSAKLKVRQPLALVELILARPEQTAAIRDHAALVAEELNVKRVELVADADKYVTYKVVPNFKAIGAKFRELVPKLKDALGKLPDAAAARRTLLDTGSLPLAIDGQTVSLTPEEVEIRLEAKPGWAAAQGRAGVVVLSTEISPELRDEGVVRELIHFIQAARKERNLPYEARIVLKLDGPPEFIAIVRKFEDVIKSECLVSRIEFGQSSDGGWQTLDIEGFAVKMAISGA